jgi:hypothetical protein
VLFASYANNSFTITLSFGTTAGIVPGHYVFGGTPTGSIVDGTKVVSVDSDTQLTIDTATTAAGTNPSVGQRTSALADDVISTRPCGQGSPTSVAGAALPLDSGRLHATAMTAMSDEGDRVFFVSPDPAFGAPAGQKACDGTVGGATACPPQLFVRQYDDSGDATVRWLSRAEDRLSEPPVDGGVGPQSIAAFGNGAGFEGASRDGSVVYFRTNAPLLEDDPNGGPGPLAAASSRSWDLYRYDLGTDNNTDPAAGDPGDRLTRISGGPDSTADPNTNCTSTAADCGGQDNGRGGVVRFMSDDGNRVYFVTAAQIPDAENAPPDGAVETMAPTAPGAQANAASRNLYLYDADKTGAGAYEFVAQIPFSTGNNIDGCASSHLGTRATPHSVNPGPGRIDLESSNCVHGSSSGDAVVFETDAQLTPDDVDDAIDIYLYRAASDELTRVSAPPAGAAAYECGSAGELCNADMGMTSGRTQGAVPLGGMFGLAGPWHWNIAEDEAGRLDAVYFESRIPLVQGDVNGEGVMDVYEWRDGRLGLVSPGITADSAFYSGNSRDGRDVFFWTEQRISGWEIDSADGDLYDARVGGGFPDPPLPPPVCGVLAGGCQAGGTGVLSNASATRSTGGGNADAGVRATLTVAGLSARARRAAARKGRLVLSVRSSAVGMVSAVATGRIGRRARRVASGSVRLRQPGKAALTLRLSRPARRALGRGRALRLSVRVSASGVRARAMSVLLPGVKR